MKFEFKKPTITLDFLDRISPFQPKYPLFAAELSKKNLVMVSMKKEKGNWNLAGYSIKEIPDDALGGSIFHPEIKEKETIMNAIKESCFKIGFRSAKISLIIPDNIVRVSLMSFQEVPSSRKQLIDMIIWKMKKSIPYKIEETMISYQILKNGDSSRENLVLVSLMPKNILGQYEDLFNDLSVRVGLIDISAFSIYNLFRTRMQSTGDVGIINCSYNYFTFMIVRKGNLLFFRCKNYQASGGALEEGTRKLLKRELNTSLSYYTEKLSGKELEKTYIRSIGCDVASFVSIMEESGLTRYEVLDPSALVHFSGFSECDEEARQKLIPAIGAVLGRTE